MTTLHDPVTGLPNAHALGALLEMASHRLALSPWLVVIRIEQLQGISTALGPRSLLHLLAALTQHLRDFVPAGSLLGRSGDAEFALLLPSVSGKEALKTARGLAESLRQPIEVSRHLLLPNPRIGLARWRSDTPSAHQLFRQARLALSTSDATIPVALFREGLRTGLLRRMRLEAELSQAVERCQLRLDYQPMISIETGQVTGFEALLRWDHPELGTIQPDETIPLAEETGLIVPIGDWVLRESCRQMAAWRERFPETRDLTLNVNVSARQLEAPDFVERVLCARRSAGLGAGNLKLELTETALLCNPDAVERLAELERHGIAIQLDDFGSGYSSLSRLSRLPIDSLKLDRSLIEEAEKGTRGATILDAVVHLASSLGLAVTAEGIETSQQADRARKLACQTGQGFFFYRPLNVAGVERLLEKVVTGAGGDGAPPLRHVRKRRVGVPG